MLRSLCRCLYNTFKKKKQIEKRSRRSVHIYIRRYLGRIPIERECFCGRDDISCRRADSYESSGIVKPEKFHLLPSFVPFSTISRDEIRRIFLLSEMCNWFYDFPRSRVLQFFREFHTLSVSTIFTYLTDFYRFIDEDVFNQSNLIMKRTAIPDQLFVRK